jgi:hypothetical protein
MTKKKIERYQVTEARRTLQSWAEYAEYDALKESMLWEQMVSAVRVLRGEK